LTEEEKEARKKRRKENKAKKDQRDAARKEIGQSLLIGWWLEQQCIRI
jgi:hypothetical protein